MAKKKKTKSSKSRKKSTTKRRKKPTAKQRKAQARFKRVMKDAKSIYKKGGTWKSAQKKAWKRAK